MAVMVHNAQKNLLVKVVTSKNDYQFLLDPAYSDLVGWLLVRDGKKA